MTEQSNAAEQPLSAFVEALGSAAPAPGGGAAAALAGALGAALAEMVAHFTVQRPRYAEVEPEARAVLAEAVQTRLALLALIDADAAAFAGVSTAYRQPKSTENERATRSEAIQRALHEAMQPPLRVMRQGVATLALAERIARIGNATLASDAGCAALLAEAAVQAGALNVRANLVSLHDADLVSQTTDEMAELQRRAADLRASTLAAVNERMGKST